MKFEREKKVAWTNTLQRRNSALEIIPRPCLRQLFVTEHLFPHWEPVAAEVTSTWVNPDLVSDLPFVFPLKTFRFPVFWFSHKNKHCSVIIISKVVVKIKWVYLWESRASMHPWTTIVVGRTAQNVHRPLVHSDQFSLRPLQSPKSCTPLAIFWLSLLQDSDLWGLIHQPGQSPHPVSPSQHKLWLTPSGRHGLPYLHLFPFLSPTPALTLSYYFFVHCRNCGSFPCHIKCLCFLSPACSCKCSHLF